MFGRQQQQNQKPKQPTFNYEVDWEEFVKLETSFNRALQNPTNFSVSQESMRKLLDNLRQLVSVVEALKLERKSYATMQEANRVMQGKLQNHHSIVQEMQQGFEERLAAAASELKATQEQIDKIRKMHAEKVEALEKELIESRAQNAEFVTAIEKLKEQLIVKDQAAAQLKQELNLKTLDLNRVQANLAGKGLPNPEAPTLSSILTSGVSSTLTSYLPPKDLKNLLRLNKSIRSCLLTSAKCMDSMMLSMAKFNQSRLKLFKKHLRHFDAVCDKIPDEMVQVAYYKYFILKRQAGAFMLPILNSCALLFEGKFVEVGAETGFEGTEGEDLIPPESEWGSHEVDEQIINLYREQQQHRRDTTSQEIGQMFKMLHNTAQLYSADAQSIGLFLTNVQRNYSRLFVFAKLLYSETKSLQLLNNHLLRSSSQRSQLEVAKTSQIEDLKAQLQSQIKIKNFFSAKSMHSQQRALALQNEKLNTELKLKDLTHKYYDMEGSLKGLRNQLQGLQHKNQVLVRDNKHFRNTHDAVSAKYNTVMQQLNVLKESLLRMNLP